MYTLVGRHEIHGYTNMQRFCFQHNIVEIVVAGVEQKVSVTVQELKWGLIAVKKMPVFELVTINVNRHECNDLEDNIDAIWIRMHAIRLQKLADLFFKVRGGCKKQSSCHMLTNEWKERLGIIVTSSIHDDVHSSLLYRRS